MGSWGSTIRPKSAAVPAQFSPSSSIQPTPLPAPTEALMQERTCAQWREWRGVWFCDNCCLLASAHIELPVRQRQELRRQELFPGRHTGLTHGWLGSPAWGCACLKGSSLPLPSLSRCQCFSLALAFPAVSSPWPLTGSTQLIKIVWSCFIFRGVFILTIPFPATLQEPAPQGKQILSSAESPERFFHWPKLNSRFALTSEFTPRTFKSCQIHRNWEQHS